MQDVWLGTFSWAIQRRALPFAMRRALTVTRAFRSACNEEVGWNDASAKEELIFECLWVSHSSFAGSMQWKDYEETLDSPAWSGRAALIKGVTKGHQCGHSHRYSLHKIPAGTLSASQSIGPKQQGHAHWRLVTNIQCHVSQICVLCLSIALKVQRELPRRWM